MAAATLLLCGCIPPAVQRAETDPLPAPPAAAPAITPPPRAVPPRPAAPTAQRPLAVPAPSPRAPTTKSPGSEVAAAPPAGFAWPARGALVTRFGMQAGGSRSDGIAIEAPAGTPVRAVADGVVSYTGRDVPSLGTIVVVRHGGGWSSLYGRVGKLLVRDGDAVKQGQSIAVAGKSGGATRPGVYLELRQGRTPVDPLTRLPR
ncbi:murein hydrolase activator EnvC family protein [Sphingomonas sp. RS6]